MALENNQSEGQTDIARFLEKFNQETASADTFFHRPEPKEGRKSSAPSNQQQYQQSFEKLEEKIRELEDKFEASAAVSQAIMQELAFSRRSEEENRKSKDAFMENISVTIAHLKESVENLSRAQSTPRLYDPAPAPGRVFDAVPAAQTSAEEYLAMTHYRPENYRAAQQAKLHNERAQKEAALAELRTVKEEKEHALMDLRTAQEEKETALLGLRAAREEKETAMTALRTERLAKETALSDLRAEKEEKETALLGLRAAQEEKETVLTELRSERQAKETALTDLHAEKEAKETVLADLQTVQKEKETVLADLQTAQEEKDAALAGLRAEREEKESVLADLQAAQTEKDTVLADLQTERAQKERALSDLQSLQSEKEEHLVQMNVEREEKARIISSLQQKASQLKAVNVALDREIKRVQQEKTEALRKSAEQAKEILSLRDALTAAEERFKSFDFEGRIISIKRHYQHKVATLENQLQEMSNTCMKQVEEIEALKAENLKLHKVAEEREQLAALYEAKTRELEELQAQVAQLRAASDNGNQARLAAFTHRMQRLQKEHETLSQRFTQAQEALQTVNVEKKTLEDNFKVLLGKIEQNDVIIEELKHKITVLSQENRELKKGRVSDKTDSPSAPVVRRPVPVRQPAAKPAAPAVRPAVQTMPSDSLPEPQSAPVEMQNTMRSKLQTDADLPEIRVAKPVPQEDLYNGEDFLEKTDSFIGRMKWSIFREDK